MGVTALTSEANAPARTASHPRTRERGLTPRFALSVGGAALSAFALSATWYAAWATPYARLLEDAASTAMPWWIPLVELGRSAVVATAVAVAVRRLSVTTVASGLLFAAAVWAAFPVVLLIGSVVHEGVSPLLAAIHAGDWLLKLMVITVLVQRLGRPRSRTVGGAA